MISVAGNSQELGMRLKFIPLEQGGTLGFNYEVVLSAFFEAAFVTIV
jgi:hypothetical protein